MTTKISFFLAAIAMFLPLAAQNREAVLTQESNYRWHNVNQLWRNTDNAAGLTIDSAVNRGVAYFQTTNHSGDYRRVQEGSEGNKLTFFTERYQKMSRHLYGYGSFEFNTGRIKDRAWSDVFRSYDNNPYFSGSSIRGRYDLQTIDLKAAIATIAFGPLRYGLTIDYKLGDLSRLRDPRSRSNLLDYRLTPAAVWSFSDRNSVGIAAYYHRRKEKIANIRTVQTDATMAYYLLTGMENANGTTGGFGAYNREWVNHELGAELSYDHNAGNIRSLTALSISKGVEDVYGTYKYEPGQYYSYRYGGYSQNRISMGNTIQQLDVKAQYEQSYADEYRQELVQETDARHGNTSYRYNRMMTFKKRYQVMLLELDLHYRSNFTNSHRQITGYAGLYGRFRRSDNKHLLDYSELIHSALTLNAEGGWSPLGNRRLWIDALAGYHFSTQTAQVLADATTAYAQNVLLPDMDYYRANYFRGRLQVSYQFPLTIKKMRSMWYVKAFADYLKTDNHLYSRTFGVSIGVFN